MSAEVLCVVVLVGLLAFVSSYLMLGDSKKTVSRMGMRARRLLGLGRPRAKRGGRREAKALLRNEDRARKESVAREMAGFLDIVTLGLGAGLSFDSSLELYCKRSKTELSRMLWDAMLLWQMGVESRQRALEDLAKEVDVPALTRFVSTVLEALAFGTPLSTTLEQQAKIIRDEQRALVEEEIERVPVKMLIPLGTLIVPAMLLAILGPLLGPAIGMA